MARTLAKQFASVFEDACAPFQYALSTRAGTDCVGHMFRAATDATHRATRLSVDGIGAYDHVLRASMLGRLATMLGGVPGMLPFVRVSYASPSPFLGGMMRVSDGQSFRQKEGNKATPSCRSCSRSGFKPLWRRSARPSSQGSSCALFLDDVYALCDPQRVKAIHDTLAKCLWRVAGIQLHRGKTKVWNKGRVPPPHVDQLGPEVWQPEGIKVLGTPIGSAAFSRERMMTRIADEQRLWDAILRVPDLQCGWQLLLQSAGPRANHMIRTLPPELSSEYASEHDEGTWRTAVGSPWAATRDGRTT